MLLRVRPTLTRFPANIRYTPVDSYYYYNNKGLELGKVGNSDVMIGWMRPHGRGRSHHHDRGPTPAQRDTWLISYYKPFMTLFTTFLGLRCSRGAL